MLMPGLCKLSGCCIAPLLFRGGQEDDGQLSHDDHLECSHSEISQERQLVIEVSVLYQHPIYDPIKD